MIGVFVLVPLAVLLVVMYGYVLVRFWPVTLAALTVGFLWVLKDQPVDRLVLLAATALFAGVLIGGAVWLAGRVERGTARAVAAHRQRTVDEQWGWEPEVAAASGPRHAARPAERSSVLHGRRWQ